jgi:hypothetical protein
MEEIFPKTLPGLICQIGDRHRSQNRRPHPFLAFQPRRLDKQSGRLVRCRGPLDFLGIAVGEFWMMLYVIRLEIYCCLNVTEIGIVAWPRRTDVVSGKEVTVPHQKDERFYWLTSD